MNPVHKIIIEKKERRRHENKIKKLKKDNESLDALADQLDEIHKDQEESFSNKDEK